MPDPCAYGPAHPGNVRAQLAAGFALLPEAGIRSRFMHLPNIDALIKHSISFHWGEHVSEAPEEPGVYAWFLPNLGSEFQSLGALFSSVQKRLDRTGALTEVVGRVGSSHLAIRQAVGSEDWEARLAQTRVAALTQPDRECCKQPSCLVDIFAAYLPASQLTRGAAHGFKDIGVLFA